MNISEGTGKLHVQVFLQLGCTEDVLKLLKTEMSKFFGFTGSYRALRLLTGEKSQLSGFTGSCGAPEILVREK